MPTNVLSWPAPHHSLRNLKRECFSLGWFRVSDLGVLSDVFSSCRSLNMWDSCLNCYASGYSPPDDSFDAVKDGLLRTQLWKCLFHRVVNVSEKRKFLWDFMLATSMNFHLQPLLFLIVPFPIRRLIQCSDSPCLSQGRDWLVPWKYCV